MKRSFFQVFSSSSLCIFALAFCWALMSGLVLQLVVLPALPSLHGGHGLLRGGDWIFFHTQAVALAVQMTQDGWGVWELRPERNAPIGLLAALYFVAEIYEPWLLLPINALLFAISAFVLHKIFKLIGTARQSFFAVLPFVMFPSAAMIYGQIHKDIFSFTGTLFIVLVWTDLASRTMLKWPDLLVRIAMMATGGALVWLVRPYLLQPLLAAGMLAALLLAVWGEQRRQVTWWCALMIFLTIQLGSVVVGMSSAPSAPSAPTTPAAPTAPTAPLSPSSPSSRVSPSVSVLEKAVSRLNASRVGFATGSSSAGSNIDTDVRFTSIDDVLLYVPRALQIGLLAPFPVMLVGDAVSVGGGSMRMLASIEMMASYVLLLGWVGFWRCGKERRATLMVAIAMSLVLTLILTLVVANVGTLYRMRYVTWQLLNGLGILGWGMWLQARCTGKNQ